MNWNIVHKILIFHCFIETQTVTLIWMKKKIIPSIHSQSQGMNWIQSKIYLFYNFLIFLCYMQENHYIGLVRWPYLLNSLISNYKKALSDSEDVVWGVGVGWGMWHFFLSTLRCFIKCIQVFFSPIGWNLSILPL